MPIYEYLCESCGRITELMQKVSDPAPKTCAECGSTHVAKLVSRSAFQLKGGGWYSDLYASKKPAAKAEGGGATEKPQGGGATEKPAASSTAAAAKPSAGKAE